MKAECDFVNSLNEETFKYIKDACVARDISGKYNRLKSKSVAELPKIPYNKVGDGYSLAAGSISTLTVAQCAGMYIPTTATIQEAPQQMGQKEATMSDLDVARRHMDNRLYSVKSSKRRDLKVQFGLADQDRPATWAEMKARLLAGQFTLPTDEPTYEFEGVSLDDLSWRDPAVKADKPGFEAAEKMLDAAAIKVKDAIWVKANAEDALALLEAFESSTVN